MRFVGISQLLELAARIYRSIAEVRWPRRQRHVPEIPQATPPSERPSEASEPPPTPDTPDHPKCPEDPDTSEPVTEPAHIVVFPRRRAKWVKPKEEPPKPKPATAREPRSSPAKPRSTRVATPEDDPEQWGQYYFRDVILDQLDRYWVYLRRMKRGDRDAYDLLRQIGIQLMPWSATSQFDRWRDEETAPELSPWWRNNRPTFGAVAYGFDDVAALSEEMLTADLADPAAGGGNEKINKALGGRLAHRPVLFGKSSVKYDRKASSKPSIIWTPRFLYFTKYARPPTEIEYLDGGDTYKLTVYWDRCDAQAPKHWRSKRHGGAVQDYAVWIERGGLRIKVLRTKIKEKIELKWAKGPRGGSEKKSISFTQTQWMVPDNYLHWSHRGREHKDVEPQEYLRRLFVEAATMYESATLGSMVRVAVSKGDLTATFGVEIKRTPYFFKDRDVVLNENGKKKRIFHIVRPHVRANGDEVPMHFRGLRDFTWADYRVSITVPGRDHFLLTDYDVAAHDHDKPGPLPAGMLRMEKLGRQLAREIKTGLGGMK